MRFDFVNPDRYILIPQTTEEIRFLTALRDLSERDPGFRIRFGGAELLGQNRPGVPPNPVSAISVVLETKDVGGYRDPNVAFGLEPKPLPPKHPAPLDQPNSGAVMARSFVDLKGERS